MADRTTGVVLARQRVVAPVSSEPHCDGCHDNTHAIAPSRLARDGMKLIALQGSNGPLPERSVCHSIMRAGSARQILAITSR